MSSPDSEYFRELPSLTSEAVSKLPADRELALVMLHHTDEGAGILFSVRYRHRELTYRSPGQKDAVAFGVAQLEGSSEFRDVRILFSKPNATASMRGLTLEGQVKEGVSGREDR